MRQPERDTDPLFRFHEISLDDLQNFPNAIEDIYRGRYHGLIVREVFDRDTAAELAGRVEQGRGNIERTTFPNQDNDPAPGYVVGAPLMLERNQDRYFAAAAGFRAGCRSLFDGLPDFEERMGTVFGAVAGGRSVQVPPGPASATYTPATIRVLPKGKEIGIHVGNEFIRQPQARQLAECADVTCQLSYFIPLQTPEGGGELVVYALEWSDIEKLRIERDGSSPGYGNTGQVATLIKRCNSMTFNPGPGDLMLFDGGRYYHRITHIEGARNRITIGGFLVFSNDGQTIYYWS